MKINGVLQGGSLSHEPLRAREEKQTDAAMFKSALEAATPALPGATGPAAEEGGNFFPNGLPIAPAPRMPAAKNVSSAYLRHANAASDPNQLSGFQKYKDDQLLRNPGGDRYYFDKKKVVDDFKEQRSFFARIGKDVSDVFGNLKKLAGNLFLGSKILYRDKDNQIQEAKQRGLVGACGDFFKNLGSALTFGAWHPGAEKTPQGLKERLLFTLSRAKKAFLGDLLGGVSESVNHMGKNIVLAGWNLVELIPDATIGNFDSGRKLTTTIFDNGQVAVEYLTDIIPSGEAWLRVHAASLKDLKPPVLYNLGMPEHYTGDVRWQHIRNTPFRKSIETIGALLADVMSIVVAGRTGLSGSNHDQSKSNAVSDIVRQIER